VHLDSNFFLESLNTGEAVLNPNESFHIVKSFRARAGDSLELCDGKGRFASAEIMEVEQKACKVLIKSVSEQAEKPKIHLAIACLANNGCEEITFHAAQMPLAAIHLLRTERSQEPRASNLSKLLRRMEAKSLAALKQSCKPWLTEIKAPVYLNEFLKNFCGDLIVCERGSKIFLPQCVQQPTAILTGPEGGFSPAELEMMKNKNANFLSLGNARLRAVSAPIFALGKIA
jgi:16S rRNA (uracil1498-N3)-methyltransferase